MGKVFESTIRFFENDDWSYNVHPDRPILRLPFNGKNGKWNCFAQERGNQLLFYSVAPVNVSESMRATVAEFVTRANYGMAIGNFELDYSDGEVRYKTCIDIDDDELTDDLIKPIVYVNCLMTDKYFPGLMWVLYGGVSPQEAVARCEAEAGVA
ncbi:MAG: YbjN domain-containing protein [Deinococcaceae bacterium]